MGQRIPPLMPSYFPSLLDHSYEQRTLSFAFKQTKPSPLWSPIPRQLPPISLLTFTTTPLKHCLYIAPSIASSYSLLNPPTCAFSPNHSPEMALVKVTMTSVWLHPTAKAQLYSKYLQHSMQRMSLLPKTRPSPGFWGSHSPLALLLPHQPLPLSYSTVTCISLTSNCWSVCRPLAGMLFSIYIFSG